jgi:hypothetical protein
MSRSSISLGQYLRSTSRIRFGCYRFRSGKSLTRNIEAPSNPLTASLTNATTTQRAIRSLNFQSDHPTAPPSLVAPWLGWSSRSPCPTNLMPNSCFTGGSDCSSLQTTTLQEVDIRGVGLSSRKSAGGFQTTGARRVSMVYRRPSSSS